MVYYGLDEELRLAGHSPLSFLYWHLTSDRPLLNKALLVEAWQPIKNDK